MQLILTRFFMVEVVVGLQMKTEKCLFIRCLLTAIWRLYFQPAKFDNFKDVKMTDDKTISVAQSKNLLDWKLLGLTNYEQLLWAVVFGANFMQLFSSDATIFSNFFAPKNIKNCHQKLLIIG